MPASTDTGTGTAADTKSGYLYSVLKRLDAKAIDWQEVGAEHGLNAPAARMRWTRYMRKLAVEAGEAPPVSKAPDTPKKKRADADYGEDGMESPTKKVKKQEQEGTSPTKRKRKTAVKKKDVVKEEAADSA